MAYTLKVSGKECRLRIHQGEVKWKLVDSLHYVAVIAANRKYITHPSCIITIS